MIEDAGELVCGRGNGFRGAEFRPHTAVELAARRLAGVSSLANNLRIDCSSSASGPIRLYRDRYRYPDTAPARRRREPGCGTSSDRGHLGQLANPTTRPSLPNRSRSTESVLKRGSKLKLIPLASIAFRSVIDRPEVPWELATAGFSAAPKLVSWDAGLNELPGRANGRRL